MSGAGRGPRWPALASLLLVIVAAAGLRAGVHLRLAGGPLLALHHWTESDMHFFRSWGRAIAAGDLLSRDAGRPSHSWHDNFAREVHLRTGGTAPYGPEVRRRLWDRWLGGDRFYQDPLYPYLLALSFLILGDSAGPVFLVQALAGIASAALVWLITRMLFGERAALAAGLLAALFGPLVLYENLLLRASAITFLGLAFLAAGIQALRRPGRIWPLAAGTLAGLSILMKSSALLVAVALPVLMIVASRREPGRSLRPVALYLAGLAVALAPLAARNIAVGVPPLSVAASGPVTFINHNAAGYDAMAGDRTSDLAAEILHKTDGRPLPAVIETLRTHPDTWAWLGLLWEKHLSFWHQHEVPNNASYDYFRLSLGPLALALVGFPLIAPLALVGMGCAGLRSTGHALLLSHAASGVLMAVVFYSISRFRAPVAMGMIPFAGFALAAGWDALQRRRWRPLLAGTLALAAAGLLVLRPLPPGQPGIRVADYGVANEITLHLAERLEGRGEALAALDLLEGQLALAPDALKGLDESEGVSRLPAQAALLAGSFAPLHRRAARDAASLGRRDDAGEHLRKARLMARIEGSVKTRSPR